MKQRIKVEVAVLTLSILILFEGKNFTEHFLPETIKNFVLNTSFGAIILIIAAVGFAGSLIAIFVELQTVVDGDGT